MNASRQSEPSPDRVGSWPKVLVQAHRGHSAAYPENTLSAVRAGFAAGADRVEVDLALTADDRVVLMHDASVERTTNGAGAVDDHTLEALTRLDAGGWKHARFAGERVPTLDEVLDAARDAGDLNCEIKSRNRSRNRISATVRAAVGVVEDHAALHRVLFSSFDPDALVAVRRFAPDARLLLIDWSPPDALEGLERAKRDGFYGWLPKASSLTRRRLLDAKASNLHVQIGTKPGHDLLAWAELGTDGFSADDPAALVDFLEAHGLR